MTTATLTQAATQFWRNGFDPRRRPNWWLGLLVALVGGTITFLAAKADYRWIGDGYRFALEPGSMMLGCGGAALLISGLTMLLPATRRGLGEWLLVGVAAIAVVLAADAARALEQPVQLPAKYAAPEARPMPQRARRVLFLKAGLQKPTQDPTAKFVMLALLGGAIGLVRSSAPTRQARDATATARLLAADVPSLPRFLALEIQLGLLVLLVRHFNLVSPMFNQHICFLIFFGFLIHYLLPLEYRLPFFLFLSFGAIVLVFGFVQAGWLIGLGLALIGLCHLPLSFRYRVGVLVLAGFALAECRMGWTRAPWSDAVWPILTSMFMFRLIVYVYTLNHRKAPAGLWSSLSYFFLLPNVVFPLFPVVDYATFHRNYYDADRHLIHQRGLKWIFWGVLHLLIYRAVYYYMVIGPDNVNSVASLARYLVSNFLLILRLSGQFHLVIGVLLLFGFDLPRIMNRFWHADSFTDFWRRANIYWRDFMQRVVFYPVYFRLRHWPATASLLFATIVVFLVTWALHAYQWFWLRGSFSMSAPDVVFWALFGAVVAANTLYDAKAAARKKKTAAAGGTFRGVALHTLRIIGVFCVICLLWSIWISTTLSEWVSLWAVPAPTWKDVTVLAPAFLAGVVLAAWGAVIARREEGTGGAAAAAPEKSFLIAALPTGAAMLALLVLAQPGIYTRLAPKWTTVGDEMRKEKLSRQDLAQLDRGYYEKLTRVDRFNSQLWEKYNKARDEGEEARDELRQWMDWRATYQDTADFLGLTLRPNLSSESGAFTTNRWGMRDKDYEKKPPPGTCRIALLGGSPEMNREVPNNKLWEEIVEERLNRDNDHKTVQQYEILNFASATHTSLHRLAMLDTRALAFQPDIVFYVAHPSDTHKAKNRLAEVVATGATIPYEFLQQIVKKAGVKSTMSVRTLRSRLEPFEDEMIIGTYRKIVELCRQHSIRPVFLYLPNLRGLGDEETPNHLRYAAEAGFTIVDLTGVYDGYDEDSLHRNEWDFHPNVKGHQIIAERIYAELRKNPALLQKTR